MHEDLDHYEVCEGVDLTLKVNGQTNWYVLWSNVPISQLSGLQECWLQQCQNYLQAGNTAGGSSHNTIFDPIVTADQLYSSGTVSGGGAMTINWISISLTILAPHRITSYAVLTTVTNRHNISCKAPTNLHYGWDLQLTFLLNPTRKVDANKQ